MLHVVLMGSVIGLDVLLRDTTWISRTAVTFFPRLWCVSSLSSPSLLYFFLCLIYPASCPWGVTALGRLLTQEKRAFNVMSLCCKAWQSRGPGHLLEEINTSPSSFSECNGLDITCPVGHYSPRILIPSYRVCVWVFVCAFMYLNEHRMCMCMWLLMYVPRRCVSARFCGGFTCIVRGNLSPREKVIHYHYTSSAGSSQAAVTLNYTNPSLTLPPSPPPSLATGDNGPNRLLTVAFQGLPLASGWVWEGTATYGSSPLSELMGGSFRSTMRPRPSGPSAASGRAEVGSERVWWWWWWWWPAGHNTG